MWKIKNYLESLEVNVIHSKLKICSQESKGCQQSKVVVKKNVSFDDYKNCVLNDTPKNVKINAIRTLKLTNYSLTQDKLTLSNKEDKRVWSDKT